LDVLSIPEYDLFLLIQDWAVAEAERENLDISAISSLRFVLLNVLPHIRFPCINHEKLAIEVRNSGLLNAEELTDLFAHCLSNGKTETKYSSKARIRGSPQQLSLLNTAGQISPGLPAQSPSSHTHSQQGRSPPSYSASSPAHHATTLNSSVSGSGSRQSRGSGSGSGSGIGGGSGSGSGGKLGSNGTLTKHASRVLTESYRKNSQGSDTGSDSGRKRGSLGESRPEGQINAGKAVLLAQLADARAQTEQPTSARSQASNKQEELNNARRSRSAAPTKSRASP